MAEKVIQDRKATHDPSTTHRRQVVAQIWVPLMIGVVITLALAVLTVLAAVQGSPDLRRWGDLSAIYLIAPVLITSLIQLVVLAGCIYGLAKIARKMPGWLHAAQAISSRVAMRLREIADKLAAPVISIGSMANASRAPFRRRKQM
jgi:FtsH-binding integral membrane protein